MCANYSLPNPRKNTADSRNLQHAGRANPPPQAARSSTESDLISDSNKKVATSPGKGKKRNNLCGASGRAQPI
jgi:hypothetical protein